MGHLQVERRVLSRPAEVWWAGFRSDTYRLQQAGWELAADEDVIEGRVRLMLRHRDMRLYALSSHTQYDYYKRLSTYQEAQLVFQVVCAAPKIEISRVAGIGPMSFENFKQLDAQPQFMESEIKSLDDMKIFATPLVRTEELIVEQQTVAHMLEQIRKMQAPEQSRIRAQERLKQSREMLSLDAMPRQKFHAQIISIEDWKAVA